MDKAPREKKLTEIIIGGFAAHLYVNRRVNPPVYHYIVSRSRLDEPETLDWGQTDSLQAAEREARKCLKAHEHRRRTG